MDRASTFEPPETWIPADRRWWGLDRRTVAPAVAVLALAVVLAGVLPAANDAVEYQEQVAAGDVMELEGGVTFVPEPGWGITAGVRQGDAPASGLYPDRAAVVDGDLTFVVRSAPFDGDAGALLTRAEGASGLVDATGDAAVSAPRTPIATEQGDQGLMTQVTSPSARGVLAAFVVDSLGVTAVAVEPADSSPIELDAVTRMIASIRVAR